MILLLIPLYALADRFTGGGWPGLDARLPGRSLFWATLACALAGWLLAGLPGALLALAWGVYRSLPWRALGGRLDPRVLADAPGVLARHAIVIPPMALIGWQLMDGPLVPALAGLGYALAATLLAFAYGRQIAAREAAGAPEGDENTLIELTRGAAFGAATALMLS